MRLENCILSGDVIVTAPLTRTEAEVEWVAALTPVPFLARCLTSIVERLSCLSEALHRFCRTANTSCSATSVCSSEA